MAKVIVKKRQNKIQEGAFYHFESNFKTNTEVQKHVGGYF